MKIRDRSDAQQAGPSQLLSLGREPTDAGSFSVFPGLAVLGPRVLDVLEELAAGGLEPLPVGLLGVVLLSLGAGLRSDVGVVVVDLEPCGLLLVVRLEELLNAALDPLEGLVGRELTEDRVLNWRRP